MNSGAMEMSIPPPRIAGVEAMAARAGTASSAKVTTQECQDRKLGWATTLPIKSAAASRAGNSQAGPERSQVPLVATGPAIGPGSRPSPRSFDFAARPKNSRTIEARLSRPRSSSATGRPSRNTSTRSISSRCSSTSVESITIAMPEAASSRSSAYTSRLAPMSIPRVGSFSSST